MMNYFRYFLGVGLLIAALVLSPWGLGACLKFRTSDLSATEFYVLLLAFLTAASTGAVFLCFRKAWVNWMLLLSVTAVCLGTIEWSLASRPEIGHEPRLQFDYNGKHVVCFPYIAGSQIPEKIKDPRTGKDLLCVAEDPAMRKKGYFTGRSEQVVLVGDSFTYGGGVIETDSLGFLLGVAFPRFNFRNYGKSGTQVEEIRHILQQALEENPGARNAIYFYNINDVLLSGPVGERQKFINDLEMVRLERIDRFATPVGSWLSRSALFRMINRVLVIRRETDLTIRNYLDSYDPAQNGEALQRSIVELDKMNQLAREKGVILTVVIYPLLYKDRQGNYPFVPIHRYLEGECSRHGIRFIDGEAAFASEKDLRPLMVHPVVDYHPNGKANRQMVDLLYKLDKTRPIFR